MGAATRFIQNPGNNAICYYRYSFDAQRDVSIVQQKDAAYEYAKTHGYHIIKEYDDPAYSGTRDDRPAFQLMLYEVEKLRPAYLILWKTDRLSRDRIDAVIAKKRLRECGVKIAYVAESIPDDDEATQILMESIYEAMAASFIVSHRKNVMRGLTYNAENALYNGIRILGYTGQPDQKYEIDDNTAPVVRRIFKESIRNQLKDVEDKLNNLVKAIEAGIFNNTTAERMNVLENQKSMLNDALLAEQNRRNCDLTLKDVVKFLNSIVGDVNDPDTRRRLLEFFIDKIFVYPDKMAMTFHFSDERRELPFEETEQLIDNQQKILSLMNGQSNPENVPAGMFESLIGNEEENSDSFP